MEPPSEGDDREVSDVDSHAGRSLKVSGSRFDLCARRSGLQS